MTTEKEYTRFINDPAMEPYFISMDDNCMTVNIKITASESNKEYIKPVGHFNNLSSALNSIAKDKTNSKSYGSIQEYVAEYNTVSNLIINKIKI
jgi:hypothetical protein